MKIIENILDRYVFHHFSQLVLGSEFPWYYGRTGNRNLDKELYRTAWSHSILGRSGWHTKEISLFDLIINTLMYNAEQSTNQLLRARLVLNVAMAKNYIFSPHVDYTEEHMTALFYLNDSDGDTIIYREKYNQELDSLNSSELEKILTVEHRITPAANKLVIFNGLHYHSGSIPTQTDKRVVMNINYTVHN